MKPEFLENEMGDEMKALLSAYAAGTLSDEERKRLFEKALADQRLFDELMEEETMRAAMEGPLAKRALLNALEEEEEEDSNSVGNEAYYELDAAAPAPAPAAMPMPMRAAGGAMRSAKVASIAVEKRPRRGVWMALAACLVAGSFGAYVYFQRPGGVYVAQAPKPTPVEVAQPPEQPKDTQAAERLARPEAKADLKAKAPVGNDVRRNDAARQEAPGRGVTGPVTGPMPAPPIPPGSVTASAPVVAAPSAQLSTPPAAAPAEAKKVNEEVAKAEPRPADATTAGQRPSAPATAPQQVVPQQDMVMALRDQESALNRAAKKESREKSALGAAQAVGGVSVPVARVVGRRLEVRGDLVGQLYVFLSVGAGFRKVPGLTPAPLSTGGPHSFVLPEGVAGTLSVLIAPQRDAQLDRLADPHEGALPVRNWTRLNFN